MENRSIFSLHGITGMLIATVLLLSILAGLTVWGLGVQKGSAANFYQIDKEKEIQMISTDNAKHRIDVK
jgi:succinate dehydrogenase/fumarate reductase cytochrome b subunit